MPKEESWEPEKILRRCTDSSPACLTNSEGSFRELDDEFFQAQTRIWLGELLHLRFDLETSLLDLLSDGDLLFQVSWVIWKMLVVTYPDMKYSKAYKNVFRPIVYGKIGSRYLPYSNVDAFLKVCQILGLTAVDLFTPSDVVEKRDVRRVCMCIRALSKRAGSKGLNVPDFDMVTYTIAMPTYVVGCIRKYWEQSRCSTTISTSNNLSTSLRRYQKRTSDAIHDAQGDLSVEDSNDTDITFKALECESPSSDMLCEPISPLDQNEEIFAVTTLDDLSSFLSQKMGLSSGKQSKVAHDYDSSLEALTDCVSECNIDDFQRQFETALSSSTLTTVKCEIDSSMGTACSFLTGIRCTTHDFQQGRRKFDIEFALPKSLELASLKTSVEDSSNKSSSSVVSSIGSVNEKICHKSNTSDDTPHSQYADDADSCCFQSGTQGTCLSFTGFLESALEDETYVTSSSSSCIVRENSDETYGSLPPRYLEANCNENDDYSVTSIFICKNQNEKEEGEDTSGGVNPDAFTNSQKFHDIIDFEGTVSSPFKRTADASIAANPDTCELSALPNVITGTFPIETDLKFAYVDHMYIFPCQKRINNIYQSGKDMDTPSEVMIQKEHRDWCYHEHESLIHACDCNSFEKEVILPLGTINSHERLESLAVAMDENTSALQVGIYTASYENENKYMGRAKRGDFREHGLKYILVNSVNVKINKCFLETYSEPCSSEVIQDFTDRSHTIYKHSPVRQDYVHELFSEPGEHRDVVVSDGASSVKHMISWYLADGLSNETIMKINTISQAELQLNSFEESLSNYPTVSNQLSIDILEMDKPKVVSIETPAEPTGSVSERLTKYVCHSLVKDVQVTRCTNYRSLYPIDITGNEDLNVSAGDTLSNSVEEHIAEESTLDIESNLQVRSMEKNVNNCHQDLLKKASRPVICSSGEQGTLIEEKAKTDDFFHVTDVNELESPLGTDSDIISKYKIIQVNCPSSFLKPMLVLEPSCGFSFCCHSGDGKGRFLLSNFRELDTCCGCNGYVQKVDTVTFNGNVHLSYVENGFQVMAKLDCLQLDHLVENARFSKCMSIRNCCCES